MKMKIKIKKVIDVGDWDHVVETTYGKPYSFQQQNGCLDRGNFNLTVPDEAEEFENDSIEEVVNGSEMGVTFNAWLERDPKQQLKGGDKGYETMWWERSFYPDIQMIANDLHEKGILEAGEYIINIDW